MAVDKSLTSGRARRAMKIGGLASHVGSSYLWASLRRPFLSEDAHTKALLDTHIKNARRIVEGSKELRGAFLKLIQMPTSMGTMCTSSSKQIAGSSSR